MPKNNYIITSKWNVTEKRQKVTETAEDYSNTPLAKLETVRKAGKEWLEQIFGRKRKK